MADPECVRCHGTGWADAREHAVVRTDEGEVVGVMVPLDAPEPTDADRCPLCTPDE